MRIQRKELEKALIQVNQHGTSDTFKLGLDKKGLLYSFYMSKRDGGIKIKVWRTFNSNEEYEICLADVKGIKSQLEYLGIV